MALKWNKNRVWINPKINDTLNGHTMDHIVMDSEIAVYAGGIQLTFPSNIINQRFYLVIRCELFKCQIRIDIQKKDQIPHSKNLLTLHTIGFCVEYVNGNASNASTRYGS